jgi:hypothetical protein
VFTQLSSKVCYVAELVGSSESVESHFRVNFYRFRKHPENSRPAVFYSERKASLPPLNLPRCALIHNGAWFGAHPDASLVSGRKRSFMLIRTSFWIAGSSFYVGVRFCRL